MDDVEIFIGQSLEGPRVGDGFFIYVLQKKGTSNILVSNGDDKECTAHSLEINALIAALKRLRRPCRLEIHSAHGWLSQIHANSWMGKWKEADWKNSKGKEVANATQLRELSEIIEKGNHEIILMDHDLHSYTKWMEFEIEKRKKRA